MPGIKNAARKLRRKGLSDTALVAWRKQNDPDALFRHKWYQNALA